MLCPNALPLKPALPRSPQASNQAAFLQLQHRSALPIPRISPPIPSTVQTRKWTKVQTSRSPMIRSMTRTLRASLLWGHASTLAWLSSLPAEMLFQILLIGAFASGKASRSRLPAVMVKTRLWSWVAATSITLSALVPLSASELYTTRKANGASLLCLDL